MGRILVADDEPTIRMILERVLVEDGHTVVAVESGDLAVAEVEQSIFDIVITDLRMPGIDGLEVTRRVREIAPDTLVLLITAFASVETAIEALHQGAHDYLLKPLNLEDVLARVTRLLDYREVAWKEQCLRREVTRGVDPKDLLTGRSPAMKKLSFLVEKVAATPSTVLIRGESGAGKEVVARAIHDLSERADELFLPVNCGAIPEDLLESQLFGHARGAFTGAHRANDGMFQRAGGGTIFLDEIGDLPLGLQVKLLRAIENKEVMAVGTSTPARVDVRIVAATNRDLAALAAEGRFREDLYYRLNVVTVHVPPLRERVPDIPEIVDQLVRRHNRELKRAYRGVAAETMQAILVAPWRGNVRELSNSIEHAMILGDGEWIRLEDLPHRVDTSPGAGASAEWSLKKSLRRFERGHIERAIAECGGDRKGAAKLLEIGLSSLYRKLDEA